MKMNNIARKIQAVIFDLDGTITKPVLDFDKIRKEIGIVSGPVWENILEMSCDKRKKAEQILLRYEIQAAENAQLNDGAKEIFDILADNDIHIAILTRNCRQAWDIVRKKFNINVDYVFTRESGPVKPDPSAVLQITQSLNICPTETLVVGDYLFDIQAGKSSGARTALIVHDEKIPEYADLADYVIRNLLEIKDIINNGIKNE